MSIRKEPLTWPEEVLSTPDFREPKYIELSTRNGKSGNARNLARRAPL